MVLVLKRTALFVFIVLIWALLTAVATYASPTEVTGFEGFAPGTIVVKTHERHLYYVLRGNRALRFPVGVGRTGMQWTGYAHIEGKYVRPAWAPPPLIRRENPRLPAVIPGGAPNNPMGVRALTLDRDEYAIHGTNRPDSIGTFASYGCIRMYNRDIVELFRMVSVGTPVIVQR
jgi:lipoprotein-anchoring transpeptidase ErfK/SrfK